MWFRVEPGRGVPIYVQLMEQIRRAVASGVLAPGEQLPSVRELALQLSINPNTVSRAYQELEHEGIIYTLRGRGTFVAAPSHTLTDRERLRRLNEAVEKLFVEAYQLRCTPAEVLAAVKKKVAGMGGKDTQKEEIEHDDE
ncbi:GntR family transcriptional regulator [Desulfofundulus sp. TPOSR]|jgi:GntR family transcriptional regulator|uniref:GntR family transcriptional regulator n=1 Tax=Desulfofundulus sp. TPOSR TaxID=2714340 RepID=UPI00140914B4|nr:GntR family transcriptional regulator [Desulfofundulus sp. TPOSR]NHM28739.1 GntR family transcriptional regulator [Desulfofundulus sp. TPOSR]HHW45047.1 GntR family transcriptional regulator [Desulfotomaculum sp.]